MNPDRIHVIAYKVLCRANIKKLPIDLFQIIDAMSAMKVCTFQEFSSHRGLSHQKLTQLIGTSEGLLFEESIDETRRHIILYNDDPEVPLGRKRFTIAHELGHFFLQHERETDQAETEADLFASQLLMPLPVLNALHFTEAEAIARVCQTSLQASEYILKKLQRPIGKRTYSPLTEQFADYIHSQQPVIKHFETALQKYKPTRRVYQY